ncbi:hypothetical protein LCGC14_2173150, partial [marine sediment metagenome]
MAVPRWQPGRNYQPSVVVQDVSSGAIVNEQVTNSDFETGDASWTKGTGWTIENVTGLGGSWRAKYTPSTTSDLESVDRRAVDAGVTKITAQGFAQTFGAGTVRLGIRWYNSGGSAIQTDYSSLATTGASGFYQSLSVTARAPELAATAGVVVEGSGATDVVHLDNVTWDYARLTPIAEVIYKSTQATPGFSGSSEPVWPTVIGNTVVDNEVTWKAVQANRVVWTAASLLKSGGSEPTWPTVVGGIGYETGVITSQSEIEKDVVLKVEDIFKNYHTGGGTIYALRGVSFEIKKGEFVGVIGPSGSGKTTLLNIMAGLDNPDRGAVYVDGMNLQSLNDKQLTSLRRDKMGFIFQFYNLIPMLTNKENVAYPAEVGGNTKDLSNRVSNKLKSVQLEQFERQYPNKLSGGQMQRVTIARSLINTPSILFADEPTGDLDSVTGEEIMNLLSSFNKEHETTVIM